MVSSLIKAVYAGEADVIDISPRKNFHQLQDLTVSGIVGGLVNFSIVIAALVFFFMLIYGGVKWILSQGDEAKVKAARGHVTHALVGLAIVFAAWAIVKLIGTVFGVGDLFQLSIPTFTGNQE